MQWLERLLDADSSMCGAHKSDLLGAQPSQWSEGRHLNLSFPSEPSGLGNHAIASMLNEFAALYLCRGLPGDPILMLESKLHLKAAG